MDTAPSSNAPRGDSSIVNVSDNAQITIEHGDFVGRDKIIGYTAEQVRVLVTEISTSFQPKPFDERSPYVGLQSFQEQDADRFFGREKLSQDLVARVQASRFVVIAGPSGSGKSSLARAGLIPALKKGALAGSENWLYEILTPGRRPVEALGRVVDNLKDLNAGDDLRQKGRTDATRLSRWLEAALGDQRTRRAILLVDQFEESFTQVTDDAERAAFFNLLLYAATVENGRVTIVCTTRSDFIGNWAAYPNLNSQLSHGLNQIPPMQDDELVSAIARPAIQVGLQIDPELVKQVLDDMCNASGALPLMQFALADLFEYEKSKGGVIALTRNDYLERGGLQKALARHADAEFAKLNADEQQIARSVFAGLIEPGRGTVDTKRTALFDELVPAGSNPDAAQNVIAKLADARLITTDEVNQHETVTLAHERLIDAWSWLRRLVDENREAIALQNQIVQDAQEWQEHQRDASYLYTGARLATAREQLAQKKIALSAMAQEFVDAGANAREMARRKEEEAKKKQESRTRRLIFAAGAVVTILVVLAVLVVSRQVEAEHQQRIARSRELAALANSKFNSSPDLAMLVAIEANNEPDATTFESEDALRQILFDYPLKSALRAREPALVTSAQFSRDGRRVVTANEDGTAHVWDAASGEEIANLQGHENSVLSAQFSPDGTRVVTASYDGTVRVWDAASGKELAVLRGNKDAVLGAQFSPDGKWLLTFGCEESGEEAACRLGKARLWDVAVSVSTGIGKELAVFGGDEIVFSAQFSPDSSPNNARIITTECHTLENPQPGLLPTCFADAARVWEVAVLRDTAEVNERSMVRDENGWVVHAQFVSNGATSTAQVVTVDHDGKVRVLDSSSGREITSLRGTVYDVVLAELSFDGTRIVTVRAGDNMAQVWDVATGELIGTLEHKYEITAAHFSPDGKQLLTASYSDQTARLWDFSPSLYGIGFRERAILSGRDSNITSAEFSSDGTQIVTSSADGAVRVWDARGGKEFILLNGHNRTVNSAQFSPDSTRVFSVGCDAENNYSPCNHGTARVWDAENGQELAILAGSSQDVLSAQFSPDGSKLVTNECGEVEGFTCLQSTARVWDVSGGKELAHLKGQEKLVRSTRFSRDGKWIVTVGCNPTRSAYCIGGAARIWDAARGTEAAVLPVHVGLENAEFSSDSKMIVTAGCAQLDEKNACTRGTARLWDISGLPDTAGIKELATLDGDTDWVLSAQFSEDKTRVLTGSRDGTARLWDARSGKELAVLKGAKVGAIRAQFSDNGARILTTNYGLLDRTVRVWDAASGKQITVVSVPASSIVTAQMSPDGSKIVMVTVDRRVDAEYSVQVWAADSGKELAILRGYGGGVNSAQFSPDGTKIVTASDDGTVRVYLVNVKDLVELAKARVGRDLSCDERETYLREANVCPTPTPTPEASPTP